MNAYREPAGRAMDSNRIMYLSLGPADLAHCALSLAIQYVFQISHDMVLHRTNGWDCSMVFILDAEDALNSDYGQTARTDIPLRRYS